MESENIVDEWWLLYVLHGTVANDLSDDSWGVYNLGYKLVISKKKTS
jgi:hypothetical protein